MTVQNTCLSGGAIEIFLEPVLPAPRVLVVGDTPIAAAVRSLGAELGLDARRRRGSDPRTARRRSRARRRGARAGRAAHARRGLETGVPYVGLVASPKRGAGVLADLRADGVPEEHLERIDVPAGIDIGARTPAEIALSILAHDRRRPPRRTRRGARPRARPRSCGRAQLDRAPDRGRPDLRDDRRRRPGHAVGRARGRDGLLLLRRLQGQVRGATRACSRRRVIPS